MTTNQRNHHDVFELSIPNGRHPGTVQCTKEHLNGIFTLNLRFPDRPGEVVEVTNSAQALRVLGRWDGEGTLRELMDQHQLLVPEPEPEEEELEEEEFEEEEFEEGLSPDG